MSGAYFITSSQLSLDPTFVIWDLYFGGVPCMTKTDTCLDGKIFEKIGEELVYLAFHGKVVCYHSHAWLFYLYSVGNCNVILVTTATEEDSDDH